MGTPLKDGTFFRMGESRRECTVAGCTNCLNAQNISGRCCQHHRPHRGAQMKDGSAWAGKWDIKRAAKLSVEQGATGQERRRA